MKKEEFVEQLRDDVEKFAAHIDGLNEEHPLAKTEDLGEADWFEQFLIFMECD